MAENDWSQPSSWSAGGGGMGGMWGAPAGGYGMQSPWGGGGYGMQSPWGSPYGGYGGGMPYGGGYPMQSPYGAPQGYGGGYSPYGMQSPYSAYGMPQQQMGAPQTMQATGEAAPAAPLTTGEAGPPPEPLAAGDNDFGITGKQTTTFVPWEPLGKYYADYLFPRTSDEYARQIALGPIGFDPASQTALHRLEDTASAPNPFYPSVRDAVTGITSGEAGIGTGGMFSDLYQNPGINNAGQYSEMYQHPGFTVDPYGDLYRRDAVSNDQQYRDMISRDAVGGERYAQLYGKDAVNESGYNYLLGSAGNAIGTGNYQNILRGSGGQGSLAGGMFGEVARGGRVDSNPYREQAIEDAMAQTSDEVKSTMSARGRYGSDAYGDAMGRALGQVATQARMAGYDTDTAQMMQAAQARSGEDLARQGVGLQAAQGIAAAQGQNWQGQLAAMQGLTGAQAQNAAQRMGAASGIAGLQGTNAAQRLAQIQGLSGVQGQNYQAQMNALQGMNAAEQMAAQQRMAAAQGLTGAQAQNWQNQLAAAQGLTGVQGENLQNRLAAAGMAPTMNAMRYDDAGRLLQVGATREAEREQQRNFTWDQLARYRGMLGNLPGAAGTQTQEQDKPWWETALGVAGVAGGMWGNMFGGGG